MIDWNRINELKKEIGLDDFDEVIGLFLEEAEDVLANLKQDQPEDKLLEYLHYLKGSALNIGFNHVAVICTKLEKRLDESNYNHREIETLFEAYNTSKTHFFKNLNS
ncbi:Hpt domain-containing protein [Parasulfitobacter algicola]|uniref:Hpt domain-containing protein n=1 Tax=Parasulfitobacter algicola TaxID=2614809 RepID=A0ABX2ITR4_9RHOB|nr:Hpt domain-containing protein [Sulfitobacter algicola]NSX53563.1 Hpt domain-containing protein [Sulfitobacter algicola]